MPLRSAHARGQVPATSPRDQISSCELPIFVKQGSRTDQNFVHVTCPMNSDWFELKGRVPETYPLKFCLSLMCTIPANSPTSQIKNSANQKPNGTVPTTSLFV